MYDSCQALLRLAGSKGLDDSSSGLSVLLFAYETSKREVGIPLGNSVTEMMILSTI